MNWIVRWKQTASSDLAAIWLEAENRREITAAAHRIDSHLAKDPQNAGESREKDRRILIESPLAIIFKIKPADKKVIVLRVWSIG